MATDPKSFLIARSAPEYTNFKRGERAEKKAILVCFFFQNFACGAENVAKKKGYFSALGELGKSI